MSRSLLLFWIILSLLPSTAFADMKRLAVLEFKGVGVDNTMLMLFSDEARSGVIKIIDKSKISVMTRESTMLILKDMGKDAYCLGDGTCEVEIARNIGADYVITGNLVKYGGEHILTLKLHDTQTGSLLSSNTADATNIHVLRKATANLSRQLIVEGIGGRSSQSSQSSKSGFMGDFDDDWDVGGNSESIVHFSSSPEGAIVMLDGELLCQATPCSKAVSSGGHQVVMQKERYQKNKQTITLEKGQKVSFELSPDFGYLNVSSSVSGIRVFLDGKSIGELPIKQAEVNKGSHVLSVQDPCYLGKEYHFSISAGQTESVTEYPVKQRSSGVKASVSDRDGNDQSAKVYVDGKYLGTSPLTEKVFLCSKEIVVDVDGQKTKQVLKLEEKKVSEMKIVLGEIRGSELVESYTSLSTEDKASVDEFMRGLDFGADAESSSSLDPGMEGGLGGVIGAKGVQSVNWWELSGGLGGGGTAYGLGSSVQKVQPAKRNATSKGSGGSVKSGGNPIILGALDKSLIDAVIKRNMSQIRYCYQRELTKNPGLKGRIVVKFVIAANGTVSKAYIKSSSMGSEGVESCIAGRFRRFKFPEPKGGGIVIVSYPFIFSS